MENMNEVQKIESKKIFWSLQTSNNARKETTHYYYSLFEGYALVRGLNTSLATGNRLGCVSFSTVGIAVDEEKLSIQTAGDQVEVRCNIL